MCLSTLNQGSKLRKVRQMTRVFSSIYNLVFCVTAMSVGNLFIVSVPGYKTVAAPGYKTVADLIKLQTQLDNPFHNEYDMRLYRLSWKNRQYQSIDQKDNFLLYDCLVVMAVDSVRFSRPLKTTLDRLTSI